MNQVLRSVLGVAVMMCAMASLAQASSIAKVNTAKVFNDMAETKDMKTKMESDQALLNKVANDRRQNIENLRKDLQLLKPDHPDFATKRRALLEAAINFRAWSEMTQADQQRSNKEQMRRLFDKIEAAVKEVAEKKGIEIVISEVKPELPEDLDALNLDQVRQLLMVRNIMYAAKQMDITDEVVALLDQKYKAGQ